MPVELKVPSVGESITDVLIGEWLKSVGDNVKKDEILVMIETDKVTVELPAPVAGVLSEIRVQNGQAARVGDVIGAIDEATMVAEAPPPAPPRAAVAPPVATPVPVTPSVEPAPKSVRAESVPPEGFARVMPAARRALAESGVAASDVTPTGPGGRLLKEDVLRARPAEPAPAPAAARQPAPSSTPGREEEVVAMTPMRKRIAERLVHAKSTMALLTTFNEIDMSAVMAMRKEYGEAFEKKYGVRLGFMSFFIKAAIDALRMIPSVNAEIRDDQIVYKNHYDISIAVQAAKGLVVPVIRNAHLLSFAQLERVIGDFGARAKENKIGIEELQGGTFTISNGGVFGSLMSTPIVNPPQTAILGMHAIQDRPVARDGQVVIRPMMYVAMTYDHRLIDGRESVTFLKRIKECVENPSRILLEV